MKVEVMGPLNTGGFLSLASRICIEATSQTYPSPTVRLIQGTAVLCVSPGDYKLPIIAPNLTEQLLKDDGFVPCSHSGQLPMRQARKFISSLLRQAGYYCKDEGTRDGQRQMDAHCTVCGYRTSITGPLRQTIDPPIHPHRDILQTKFTSAILTEADWDGHREMLVPGNSQGRIILWMGGTNHQAYPPSARRIRTFSPNCHLLIVH